MTGVRLHLGVAGQLSFSLNTGVQSIFRFDGG